MLLKQLIGPEQSSFVTERQITDRIILLFTKRCSTAFEKRKEKLATYMILKIDLEKAYDKFSWDFIKDTLREADFNEEYNGFRT